MAHSVSLKDFYRLRKLHPSIEARVSRHLENESWDEAVYAAFKVLEERIRVLVNDLSGYGVDLVIKAFDENRGVLNDYNAPTAEREGLKFLFMGAVKYFRNPLAHKFMDMSRDDAMDVILFTNRLLTIVESHNRIRHVNREAKLSIPQFRYGWNQGPLVLDTDGDGETEIVTRSPEPDRIIEVSRSIDGVLRQQDVEPPSEYNYWFFSDAAVLDMDGDGINELVCFCEGPTQGSALLIYRQVDGRYILPVRDPSSPEDSKFYAPWFADATLADFDNDGYIEILSRPYITIPDDLLPRHSQYIHTDSEPQGRILYVWKWSRSAGYFSLIHRSFQSFGKWSPNADA